MRLLKYQIEAIASKIAESVKSETPKPTAIQIKKAKRIYKALREIDPKVSEALYIDKHSEASILRAIVKMETNETKVKPRSKIIQEVMLASIEAKNVDEIFKKVKPT